MTNRQTAVSKKLIALASQLSDDLEAIDFGQGAPWVYNPLRYAWDMHVAYLQKFGRNKKKIVLLGMNPGPWGMAQTGVPFGEIAAVRDWLNLSAPINRPEPEHPKRPVEGMDCPRSEVSGRRLWGLFADEFDSATDFAKEHFVANYCPLAFMADTARNVTPDKLPKNLRVSMGEVCDNYLAELLRLLQPSFLIGIGKYAEDCMKRVVENIDSELPSNYQISRILHPSPASPAANRDWAGTAKSQLIECGAWGA